MTRICTNDWSLGPGANCRSLDFTLLFSNIFLVVVPALILLILGAFRIIHLVHKPRRLLPLKDNSLSGIALLIIKVACSVGLLCSNVAFWVKWERTDELASQWSGWVSNAFQTLVSIALLTIITAEHFRCNRPSQPAALYLLVSILLIATRIRSFALLDVAPLAELGACLGFTFALFLALQFSTRSALKNGPNLPPAATAGLVSRYLVTWALRLLWRGYRKPLEMDSVGSIDESLHSFRTWEAFEPQWKKQMERYANGKTRQPVFWALFWAFGGLWAAPIIPYIISSTVSMGTPLILNRTVRFVDSYISSDPQDLGDGWALAGATALTFLSYALSTALAHIAVQRSAIALRGALMEALYRKSLVIKVASVREMGAAKASNLMSVDVNLIIQTVIAIHGFWTAFLMTGLALYIIYTQIGISFLATVGGSMLFFLLLPFLTKNVSHGRKLYGTATDVRVKFMASVFRHIKAVKMSAYESQVIKTAVDMRTDEIEKLRIWIREILKVAFMANWLSNCLTLVTIITFTLVSIYSSSPNQVNTAKIFTVVSTISIISEPLLMLGQRFGSLLTAWASLKRIEEFLLLEERQERLDLDSGVFECRVELHNATFGVQGEVDILRNLEIQLVNPSLWMVVGKVGCGKSTLLHALLGELDLLSGTTAIHLGAAGYCSQDPWLTVNQSVRENITFMHPYDANWYNQVIRAVALDVDLALIKGGDTVAASALSGGQKQRVALARAVYGKFSVLVLDDVFSALDADTEAKVFTSLFGPSGLLRGKSVILATNQVNRFADASYITVLHDGSIAEQGVYSTLLAQDGLLAKLVQEFASEKRGNRGSEVSAGARESDSLDEAVEDAIESRREGVKGAVKWKTYLWYLRGMGYVYAGFWVLLIVVSAIVGTSVNIYLQAWTQTLAGAPRSKYGVFLGGYAGIQVGYLLCFVLGIGYAFLYAHPLASNQLHKWQIQGVLSTSLSYFESKPIGEMVNRFNSDLNVTDMALPNEAVDFMSFLAKILGSFVLIGVAGTYMVAVLVGTAIVMVLLQRFYVRAGRELRRLDLTSRSPIYTLFSETINADGLRTIRAMKAQNMCMGIMTKRCTASQHPAWLLFAVQKWLELSLNMCVTVVNTLLVVIAVANRDSISAGLLALAMSEASNLNLEFTICIVAWTDLEMSITSIERIQEYIELPPQENMLSTQAQNFDWLQHGAIRFENVSARYAPDLPLAVSDVSFIAKPGQRVGICGRSGSGKSSLLSVLWRMIDQEAKGGVFVDGMDIRQIPLQTYRSAMSIIPQDPLVLELSLRANLDPEGLHNDADIWEALEKSHLKQHVETLEGKLDEVMAGDGSVFSRGQRQLLALARAILRRRRILALDEATSSIDVRTDAAIQETIRTAFDSATVLTIAHRISTIIDYDKIIVMDQGSIVEMGEPQELLGREGSVFRRLAMESGALGLSGTGEASSALEINDIDTGRIHAVAEEEGF